jgi:hypothetical protein
MFGTQQPSADSERQQLPADNCLGAVCGPMASRKVCILGSMAVQRPDAAAAAAVDVPAVDKSTDLLDHIRIRTTQDLNSSNVSIITTHPPCSNPG